MANLVSPGVQVKEIDLTAIIPAVSTTKAGFAGFFSWGPVGQRITVTSENELVERFSTPDNVNYPYWFTAANYLGYSNNLQVVRVVNETSAKNASTGADGVLVKNTEHFEEVDSTITAANHEFVEDSELSTEDLYVSEICFHARKNHPLTKKKIVRCADLINYPLLTYRTLIAKKRVKERLTTEEQLSAFQKNFLAGTLNSMQGTLPFVEATDYLAMTERGFYDAQSPASQIKELEIEDFRLKLQIKICSRAKHILSAREQDLINCFKNAAAARVYC